MLPALAALPVFVVLCSLGAWQVRRLAWKTDLLARIEAYERAAPVPLGSTAEPYAKVVASGRFDHGREASLGVEVRGASLGAHLLTPLLRAGLPTVLVDRGWVPLERSKAIDRPEGEVAVTGFVREADQRDWLSPTDDLPGRRFYTFDPASIGRAVGLPEPPASILLVALAPAGAASTLPDAARSLPRPTNPHLGYIITWYGLAAALVAVVAAFVLRRFHGEESA